MTQLSLNGILDDENVDGVVNPAGEEVDFARVEQHSHCQVTRMGWSHLDNRNTDRNQHDEICLEKPCNTFRGSARRGQMLQLPSGSCVLKDQREAAEGHDGATERSEQP